MNPAEFLADLISVDYSSAETVHLSQKRIDDLIEAFSNYAPDIECVSPVGESKEYTLPKKYGKKTIVKRKQGWWRQFWLLLKRAWMQVYNSMNFYFMFILLFVLCVVSRIVISYSLSITLFAESHPTVMLRLCVMGPQTR